MPIEELVNRYFEGETTCEEERELRYFFTQSIVPEHLEIYRSMFSYFDKEKKQLHSAKETENTTPTETKKRRMYMRPRWAYTLSGIAAGIALVISITSIYHNASTVSKNYVIIDGKYYTDESRVREEAMQAFNNVSFTEDEFLQTLLSTKK